MLQKFRGKLLEGDYITQGDRESELAEWKFAVFSIDTVYL